MTTPPIDPSPSASDADRVATVIAEVHANYPTASYVVLSSSDQDLYGYVLDAVLIGPERVAVDDGETFERVREATRHRPRMAGLGQLRRPRR